MADGAPMPQSAAPASRGAAAGAARMRALTEGPIGPTLIRLSLPNIAMWWLDRTCYPIRPGQGWHRRDLVEAPHRRLDPVALA